MLAKINNTRRDWRKIIADVRQGSILGPPLSNIFSNNIFFFLKDVSLSNYPDYSTLYAYKKNIETVICNIRQQFSILSNWFYDN